VEIRDRFVTLGGLRFHYREVGDPQGHPAVLLHALGAGCSDWDQVAQALATEHRVLALEMRGSFASPRTEQYSFELMRDDVREFADELGLQRFALVGHSMGGTVAYLFAEEWPERLDRLVVEDTAPPVQGRSWTVSDGAPPPDLPFDVEMGRAILRQLNEPNPAWWRRLSEITVPTLVVAGGPDSHVPQEELVEVGRWIPGCRLIDLGGGHRVHAERLAEFVAAVREFLG